MKVKVLNNTYIDFKETGIKCIDSIIDNNKVCLFEDDEYDVIDETEDEYIINIFNSINRELKRKITIQVCINISKNNKDIEYVQS